MSRSSTLRRRRRSAQRGAALLTRPTARVSLLRDFSVGTGLAQATFASATTPSLVTSGGKTRISWASATSSQYAGVKFDGPWDLSLSSLFLLDLAVPDGTERTSTFAIYFCFDAGTTFTNFAKAPSIFAPRRAAVPITKASCTVTGVADWANVRRIEIRYTKTTSFVPASPVALDLYGLYSHVQPRVPRVVHSLDDADATMYSEFFAYAQPRGVPMTLFLNGGTVGTGGAVSLAQVREMVAAGWEVASHTYSHTALAKGATAQHSGGLAGITVALGHGKIVGDPFTTYGGDQPEYAVTGTVSIVSDAQIFGYNIATTPQTPGTGVRTLQLPQSAYSADVVAQETWEAAQGLAAERWAFAYPYGHRTEDAWGYLQSRGVKSARTTATYPSPYPTGGVDTYLGLRDPGNVPCLEMNHLSTAASLLAQVDAAIALGCDINVYGHTVVTSATLATQISRSEFQAYINGIAARRATGTLVPVAYRAWLRGA